MSRGKGVGNGEARYPKAMRRLRRQDGSKKETRIGCAELGALVFLYLYRELPENYAMGRVVRYREFVARIYSSVNKDRTPVG